MDLVVALALVHLVVMVAVDCGHIMAVVVEVLLTLMVAMVEEAATLN
jgi:hypothetical protein